jgi:hypothetical protein
MRQTLDPVALGIQRRMRPEDLLCNIDQWLAMRSGARGSEKFKEVVPLSSLVKPASQLHEPPCCTRQPQLHSLYFAIAALFHSALFIYLALHCYSFDCCSLFALAFHSRSNRSALELPQKPSWIDFHPNIPPLLPD